MKKNFYVYHLVSNGKTIYVGLTSTPSARFRCHISCSKTKRSALYSFMKSNKVEMKLVSVHSSKMEGSIAEIAEIMSLRNDGVFLFNIEAGGLKFKKTKQVEYFKLQKSLAKAA
jgi:predicted GIY-YIG superfamily endonuclease